MVGGETKSDGEECTWNSVSEVLHEVAGDE